MASGPLFPPSQEHPEADQLEVVEEEVGGDGEGGGGGGKGGGGGWEGIDGGFTKSFLNPTVG